MDPRERFEAVMAEMQAAAQEDEAADAEWERRRADAARGGELGPEWQRTQRRIDRGDTTVGAVFDGTDESDDARVLRERATDRFRQVREELDAAARDDPDALDVEREGAGLLHELTDRLQELRDRIGEL